MKAVGYHTPHSIDAPDALVGLELPPPVPGPRDLLVSVRAISVNPVDTKVRRNQAPGPGQARILGWDASGVVEAVGTDVTMFAVGDEVYYAGAIDRPGSNAELQLVDERIAAKKPATLSFAESAALPLTSITAWELLFDRLQVPRDASGAGQYLLVVGGAGGVGSILIQLARQLTHLTIIATASRPETAAWCTNAGAHYVIDHRKPLHEELVPLGIPHADYVASLTATDQHLDAYAELIRPQGRIAVIDDPQTFDIKRFKRKSVSVHWEFMFTRSVFETPDMIEQHRLLSEVAALVDAGTLRTTVAEHYGVINAENLKRAHALIESGRAKGKIVLEGFSK